MENKLQYIFEDDSYVPNGTGQYSIKTKTTTNGKTYEFGLKDNLLVYREKGSTEWLKYNNDADKIVKLKKELFGLERGESSTNTNTQTKGKCLAITTPPAGLALNIKNPGDKNYIYGKVGDEWFAQNVKNKKIFNLTKCNYTTSIAKLEKLKQGSTNTSVEQLQSQSKEIQKSAGLPETGSFDIQALERLIKLLSDDELPKVQSVQDLVPNAKIQTPNAEEQLKQIASQQTIRQ